MRLGLTDRMQPASEMTDDELWRLHVRRAYAIDHSSGSVRDGATGSHACGRPVVSTDLPTSAVGGVQRNRIHRPRRRHRVAARASARHVSDGRSARVRVREL